MVIDRILLEGARHRIVGAEWCEALSDCRRNPADGTCTEVFGGCEKQLVHISVRMPSIDVAFAVDAGGQLAAFDGASLEVDSGPERKQLFPRVELGHDHRLCEIAFAQISPVNGRRLAGSHSDCLGAQLEKRAGFRHLLRGGQRIKIIRRQCALRSIREHQHRQRPPVLRFF